ncbi:MAG: pilus assembly protein TadG-related protein [Planctomycetaceae bacterium]
MKRLHLHNRHGCSVPPEHESRRGIFIVVAVLCFTVLAAFVSFAVDLGFINFTRTRMQNAVDAAALAAAQEITYAVQHAGPNVSDVAAYAQDEAGDMAAHVAELNGIYVDANVDVEFGRRSYNDSTEQFEFEWGVTPANAIRVTARRDNDDASAPDGKLPLFFAGIIGHAHAKLQVRAVAYVDSRDIVVVHDFSRSMNFDSYYNHEASSRLTRSQVRENMLTAWSDLDLYIPNFPNDGAYLTQTSTDSGVTTTVKFKYDDAEVTTTGELSEVKLEYTDGSTSTFNNVSGTTANVDGSKNIYKVTVKSSAASTGSGGGSSGGTGSGPPVTVSGSGIDVTFSGDRKSYSVSSTKQLVYVDSYFTNGSYQYHDINPYGYSASFNESSAVDYVWIYYRYYSSGRWRYKWEQYDAPPAGSGGSSGGGGSTSVITQTFFDTDNNVKAAFGMNDYSWPYPYGSWNGYIDHVRTYAEFRDNDNDPSNTDYRECFGGATLMNYLLLYYSSHYECPDLWKTRHYPFHAIKEGHLLLCDFLQDLGFDDEVGMVSYDTNHRIELTLNESDPDIPWVDISSDPITSDYESVRRLMLYKQASHYSNATNMGGGLKDAIALLDASKRSGAQTTIILMTDGNTNTIDGGEDTSLPSDWDWDALFDYDGDGTCDYYANSTQQRYVLRLAKEAVDKGYTIHTMAVGVDADTELMEAIAWLANGHFINIPGGSSVEDMEDEVREAFNRIAAFVPPARLTNDPGEN